MKEKIVEVLKLSKGVVLGAHVNPDGDAIGALVGMGHLCAFLSIPYTILLDSVPKVYQKLLDGVCVSDKISYPYDTFVSLDCGDIERLGKFAIYFKEAKTTINIDHHVTNSRFATYNEICPEASSSCEVVFDLIKVANCPLTLSIATSLYTGIVTDTGGFMHSCTSPHTHQVASELLAFDYDFSTLYYSLLYERTEVEAKIEAVAILNASRYEQMVITYVTQEEMDRFGATKEDLSSIVSAIKAIKGCELAVFIYPIGVDVYKVSFRSNPPIDVAMLASKFNGGGHVRAAGATLYGSLENVQSQIEEAIHLYVK